MNILLSTQWCEAPFDIQTCNKVILYCLFLVIILVRTEEHCCSTIGVKTDYYYFLEIFFIINTSIFLYYFNLIFIFFLCSISNFLNFLFRCYYKNTNC